jgi:probable F420-dependent oxidoreductase
MGYDHVAIYDHVLGADPAAHPGWKGAYQIRDQFHEPMVLYGYAAGVTKTLGLVTAVIVLPQRQTALAAKQAAEVDVLSGGRLRFGVGIGWNAIEYDALDENFHNRGKRSEEQIALLRELWTKPSVTFSGRWHKVTGAGINPLPVQRPIPIWLGGRADEVIERVVRAADGWFPLFDLNDQGKGMMEKLRTVAAEHGRAINTIGIEGRLNLGRGNPDDWHKAALAWKAEGATHLQMNTMGAGCSNAQAHLSLLKRALEAVRV